MENHVHRIGEQLRSLPDRCNRMMLRNLKTPTALREGPTPSVSTGSAGQVNVAARQMSAYTHRRQAGGMAD